MNGKIVLVTGAARGIGFETARQLHGRGASVAVLDLDREQAEEACQRIGERTLALDADVTDLRAMELATREVVERFGGLDVVVANSGIAPEPRPTWVMGTEMFDRDIVVVASIYAFLNGVMAAPYAMAKAGVEALGRALRVELAPHGASAGVAYFGFIDTDMVRDTLEDPIAQRVEEAFPNFVTKRLTPDVAGRTIVDGTEKRAPRMIAPRWWGAWSALRGLVNPVMDRWALRDEDIASAIRQAERDAASRSES